MSERRQGSRAGYSLIELVISVGLLGVVLASAGLVSRTSQSVYRQSSQTSALEARARQALDRVVEQLATMVRSLTFPDPAAPGWTETLDFQQATGVVGGALTWGPPLRLVLEMEDGELEDGLDNDDDGRVDEGRLVLLRDPGTAAERRTVLCRGIRGLAEREVANGIDDNGNGMVDERGFCVQRRGDVMRVMLTLEEPAEGGRPLIRTVTTSLRIRN